MVNDTINVVFIPFKKTESGWKVLMGGGISGFEPEEGENIEARIAELIENDSAIQLRSPEDDKPMGKNFDEELTRLLLTQ